MQYKENELKKNVFAIVFCLLITRDTNKTVSPMYIYAGFGYCVKLEWN